MTHDHTNPRTPYAAWHHRVGVLALVILLPTIASAQRKREATRATVPPNAETLVPFQTLPNAVCSVTAPDETGKAATHKFYADEDGIVRFYVFPPAESEQVFKVAFSCAAENLSETVPVELRASRVSSREMPAPQADLADRAMREHGTLREPLVGDPATIPDEKLLSMGYPPRPDRTKDPEKYEVWLRLASQPVKLIEPRMPRTAREERFRNVVQSSNWAGFQLKPSACNIFVTCEYFNYIEGAWHVPRVWNTPGNSADAISGLWIGLDGGGAPARSRDILQTGSASQAFQTCWFSTICWGFTQYWTWTEWYPTLPHNTPIQVNPGDWIFAEAWYPGSGRVGHFFLQNITQGTATTLTENMPSGIPYFTGDSAEWIMERQPGPLPPFWSANMQWAYVEGPGCPCDLGNTAFVEYDMRNGWDLLTYPVMTGPASMSWYFVHSQ